MHFEFIGSYLKHERSIRSNLESKSFRMGDWVRLFVAEDQIDSRAFLLLLEFVASTCADCSSGTKKALGAHGDRNLSCWPSR